MSERVSDSLGTQRSPALLGGLFSAVALLLAGIGIYGVLAYAVAQRRREIGVRMALGAAPWAICRQFLLIGLRQVAVGIVLGLIGLALVQRLVGHLLFDAPFFPVAATAVTAAIVAGTSLAACLFPSRRAATISPVEALRAD